MIALFDHEEVGSDSTHGAGSPVMKEALERVSACLVPAGARLIRRSSAVDTARSLAALCQPPKMPCSAPRPAPYRPAPYRPSPPLTTPHRPSPTLTAPRRSSPLLTAPHGPLALRPLSVGDAETLPITIRKSFLISADTAHAVHPNWGEKHEVRPLPSDRAIAAVRRTALPPRSAGGSCCAAVGLSADHPRRPQSTHSPKLNKGTVIKTNDNQRYATNSESGFVIRQLAKAASIGVQEFVVKNDCPCGMTIGEARSGGTQSARGRLGRAVMPLPVVPLPMMPLPLADATASEATAYDATAFG